MRASPASVLYHPLDEILGSTALVRVTRVLSSHGGSLAVSDIALRTRLTLPSVRSALRRLLELEVVTAVGMGRSMACALRPEHPLAPALVALFEAEREQAGRVLRAVREAAATLRPAPLGLWLYGSVARGEDTATSDIDVAMVSAEAEPTAQASALYVAIADALPGWTHRISIVAFGLGDVKRLTDERADFWREIERDAVVLAGEAPAGVRVRVASWRVT